VYVFNAECSRSPTSIYDYGKNRYGFQQARSSLLFYLDKPVECIEERDIREGRRLKAGYVIIDQASLDRFGDRYFVRVGSGSFTDREGDFDGVRGRKFVLARLQEPARS
jgi:hypothetical protein